MEKKICYDELGTIGMCGFNANVNKEDKNFYWERYKLYVQQRNEAYENYLNNYKYATSQIENDNFYNIYKETVSILENNIIKLNNDINNNFEYPKLVNNSIKGGMIGKYGPVGFYNNRNEKDINFYNLKYNMYWQQMDKTYEHYCKNYEFATLQIEHDKFYNIYRKTVSLLSHIIDKIGNNIDK